MTHVPDVFRSKVSNLSINLIELRNMANVVESLMAGDIAKDAKDGTVEICQVEAEAIYYMAVRLCIEIRKTVAEFDRDFLNSGNGGDHDQDA